ncbi:MAG TPA: HlyD family efflux transporter periplasmic adaptor subunit [Burkholderiales bacterium]|nr:HlyD family efflux transporter periplasmic adaptor subunit [Burkholderiales bacterium]
MKTANKLALAVLGVSLLGVAAWALRPQPIAVQTASVVRGGFEQAITEDGKTRVRDRYVVSAPLAGSLQRVQLKVGDAVRAGQVVAVLLPAAPAFLDERAERELSERLGTAQALHRRAVAETQRAGSQLAQARIDVQRSRRLAVAGFLSPGALEQVELAARTADKTLEAAKFAQAAAAHDIEQARAALSRYRGQGTVASRWEIRSPIDGSVLRVVQESEGAVALGAPLIEVADARSLEVVVDVLSQDAVAIRPGMQARLQLGAGVAPVAATVRLVEPGAYTKVSALGIEEQRVNVVLDPDPDLGGVPSVGDGFRVEARIVVFRAEEVLKVPVGAMFRDGTGWAVFVVEGGRARRREFTLLRSNGEDAMVGAGLQAGESVVAYPPDALADGRRVRALSAGAAPSAR